jgi:DNA invertase Pin-like site-specific DNA recombinase
MAVRRSPAQPRYAVALYRVSTAEQGHSDLGLEAQQASVRAFVEHEGWRLVAEHQDIASGKDDRRPGFQAALPRCRQLGAVLVAARLDRITRRAHTLSQLLEEGISIRAADMPGADDLMMRVYAAMAQKERELISERTRAALAAARARGAVLGGDRGWRPAVPPCATAAASFRAEQATRTAHRLALEFEALRAEGITTHQGLARALTERGVPAPCGGITWTHIIVARVVGRLGDKAAALIGLSPGCLTVATDGGLAHVGPDSQR